MKRGSEISVYENSLMLGKVNFKKLSKIFKMPFISSSMELLFGRFSKTPIAIGSVNVVPIRHRNSHIPYTGSETVDNGLDSWESLVVTTLSLLILFFYFKLFEHLGSLGSSFFFLFFFFFVCFFFVFYYYYFFKQ